MTEKSFMMELRACMHDGSRVQNFMDHAEDHPPQAWLKAFILFSYAKGDRRPRSVVIDQGMVTQFIDTLVKNFPDVLQRVLLRGSLREGKDVVSPLHIAVVCGLTQIVELLTTMETKAHVKSILLDCAKNTDGFTAVQRAALWGNMKAITTDSLHIRVVGVFLKEFDAARNAGDSEMLDNLIDQANLYPNDAWRIALLWASASGEVHILQKFKKSWPERFKRIEEKSQKHGFPLFRTIKPKGKETRKKEQEIYDLVSDLVNVSDNYGSGYPQLLARVLHARIGCGWTALHMAAISGNEDMLNMLINCYKRHPTWEKISSKMNRRMREYRLNDFSDDFWMTPLHYAVLGNNEKVMGILMEWHSFKEHINDSNLFLCTAFHMACNERNKSKVLRILLNDPDVDVNALDCCSFTGLHWAILISDTDMIRTLLSHATDPERPIKMSELDSEGRQAFAIAVENKTWKLLTCLPEVKDEVERLYRDRQVYVDAANAILVGAALIASVTFGGWLSPPQGKPGDFKNINVQVYWAFNSLSFFSSIAAVMAGAGAVLPMDDVYVGNAVQSIREWLILTSFLLILSVAFVLGAFISAGYAALEKTVPHLDINMTTTTVCGSLFCAVIGTFFLQKLYGICYTRSLKIIAQILEYLRHVSRRIARKACHPLTPSPSLYDYSQFDHKNDWDVLGHDWKRREPEWRTLHGIHHFGYIPATPCRTFAVQYQKFAYIRLSNEYGRYKDDVGKDLAELYEDVWSGTWSPGKGENVEFRENEIFSKIDL